MKTFARIAQCDVTERQAEVKVAKPRVERQWMKVDGKLECRFVAVR